MNIRTASRTQVTYLVTSPFNWKVHPLCILFTCYHHPVGISFTWGEDVHEMPTG
jgi:hypothetical protein